MAKSKNLRFALIGSDTLRGREIKGLLGAKKFPLRTLEFFDPDVEEEYSKLTQFHNEPKVIHHLEPGALEGLDLVFLAADPDTNLRYGGLATGKNYRALDLSETFNHREDIPVVVAGVNDTDIRGKDIPLIANPNPATVILSHLFRTLSREYGLVRAASFILQPVSAFEAEGIQELVDQSYALLGGSTMPQKTFGGQVAFNLLAQTEKPDKEGFSALEKQIHSEIRRVLGSPAFDLSLSVVLVPVFHTYSVMTQLELDKDAEIADLERTFRENAPFRLRGSANTKLVSSAAVAGKNHVYIGPIKKVPSLVRNFWIWAVADNLTLGSAFNAYEIARTLFSVS